MRNFKLIYILCIAPEFMLFLLPNAVLCQAETTNSLPALNINQSS